MLEGCERVAAYFTFCGLSKPITIFCRVGHCLNMKFWYNFNIPTLGSVRMLP